MPIEGPSPFPAFPTQNRNWFPLLALCASLLVSLAAAGQCGGDGCCSDASICNAPGLSGQCDSSYTPCECIPANVSPIIVDTTGRGFHLTSSQDGVMFDFFGDGRPLRMAWTAADSGNAFLALDRNGNGRIDNAKELFGNITKQPKSDNPNGYLALAEFDKPENGGNGDGIIDSRDAIFPSLLLWIDENHDGISQPNELYSLPELGVYSIGLHYHDDASKYDQFGNWFHYQGLLNPDRADGQSNDGRTTYDVFFAFDYRRGSAIGPSADGKAYPFLREDRLSADLLFLGTRAKGCRRR